ncbi:MAG: ABC transporter substrate-binding protein [Clostridia bacterium]|nr:ABC transporter substrate-binding protein [Clostridia bacterium]
MKRHLILLLFLLLLMPLPVAAGETLTPDTFIFRGGSGRVTLSCTEVRVDADRAYARISFDSPRYTRILLDGTEYPTQQEEAVSWAEIPAFLNRSFDIQATTTAMSQPHDITYTLYIGVDKLAGEEVPGLQKLSVTVPQYARGFTVDEYENGLALIRITEGQRFLVVPEGQPVPEGLHPDIRVLTLPLQNVYLAATSVMSLADATGALDQIAFSSIRAEEWEIPAAREAMEQDRIRFAGKYDAPDYELLVREGCDLAIESTMIGHSPKIMEMLELLGIPVWVDRSSYEPHPLGRTEWIRLYGILFGKRAEADRFFEEQAARVTELSVVSGDGGTVAFFYINANGAVVVRNVSDYIPEMIRMAGGTYVPEKAAAAGVTAASVTMSMESFYQEASEADYLIYNAAIDAPLTSVSDLVARNSLFSSFKAVQSGQVYCAQRRMYQATATVSDFILDVRNMFEGQGEMTFLTQVR